MGIGEILKELVSLLHSFFDKKRHAQHAFMLNAIGGVSCLDPNTAVEDFVSLESVDRRVRNAQKEEPDYADEHDIPAVDDPRRGEKLQLILRDMVKDGSVQFHPKGRWKVARTELVRLHPNSSSKTSASWYLRRSANSFT